MKGWCPLVAFGRNVFTILELSIKSRLRDLGWGSELDNLSEYNDLDDDDIPTSSWLMDHPLVKKPQLLTDKG